MKKEVVIRFDNVIKTFGNKKVLDGLNLEIPRGKILGIIGSSGSGKTTLLHSLVGFYGIEEGDILFKPMNLVDVKEQGKYYSIYKKKKLLSHFFGFASQSPSFYSMLTCEENLRYFGTLQKLSKEVIKINIEHLLNLTGLDKAGKTVAKHLSGGMQKRLGIACALIHKPYVLILDEPTSDLDPILRRQIWDLIKEINNQGTTVIIASHFFEEIDLLCDKIGILYGGKILEEGTPEQLKKKYTSSDEIIIETLDGKYGELIANLNKNKQTLKIQNIIQKRHSLIIYSSDSEKVLHEILHFIEKNKQTLLDVEVNKPSLIEVFENLIKK